ncbi:MAG TPA: phosphate--acyl-ACP acyltransferase, partial [Bacillota bacterium]|nr:phosphate--acyl-ACP acyltransferase [Bacillota bacterium]
IYSEYVLKKKNPRDGLLNVGSEEGKGNELSKSAYELIKESGLRFVGNIEARDALMGKVDVIVCDGFSGNILLKAIEGAGAVLFQNIKNIIGQNLLSKMGALMMKKGLYEFKKKYDYRENGGAPFLGVRKCVMKAHGGSRATSVYKTILQCCDFIKSELVLLIEKKLNEIRVSEV